eukprot:jgi/Botrbrau1/14759/Bobra.0103s0009.1
MAGLISATAAFKNLSISSPEENEFASRGGAIYDVLTSQPPPPYDKREARTLWLFFSSHQGCPAYTTSFQILANPSQILSTRLAKTQLPPYLPV